MGSKDLEFLSRLYGVEAIKYADDWDIEFLSRLYGVEVWHWGR